MSGAKEKKKIGLTTQIFIALILGAILGIVLHVTASDVDFVQNVFVNGIFYVVGQGFIRLMQMLVVPLVFCSLICGATAIGDSKTLGKVGVKIIGFYIFTTMMAVAVAVGIGLLIKPGLGLDMSQVQQVETGIEGGQSVSFAETILNVIPKNPIGALANGEMLQVIVFALIVGIILAKLQDPYVWGGSSPSTSFDCSGFVSYVLTNSGLCNTGRLGAQGLYNISTRVSDPQPGDLVFFIGTYDTAGISHVGFYVGLDEAGNPMFLHCGDPIQYARLNTSYWQQHFYAYGRPPYD